MALEDHIHSDENTIGLYNETVMEQMESQILTRAERKALARKLCTKWGWRVNYYTGRSESTPFLCGDVAHCDNCANVLANKRFAPLKVLLEAGATLNLYQIPQTDLTAILRSTTAEHYKCLKTQDGNAYLITDGQVCVNEYSPTLLQSKADLMAYDWVSLLRQRSGNISGKLGNEEKLAQETEGVEVEFDDYNIFAYRILSDGTLITPGETERIVITEKVYAETADLDPKTAEEFVVALATREMAIANVCKSHGWQVNVTVKHRKQKICLYNLNWNTNIGKIYPTRPEGEPKIPSTAQNFTLAD